MIELDPAGLVNAGRKGPRLVVLGLVQYPVDAVLDDVEHPPAGPQGNHRGAATERFHGGDPEVLDPRLQGRLAPR